MRANVRAARCRDAAPARPSSQAWDAAPHSEVAVPGQWQSVPLDMVVRTADGRRVLRKPTQMPNEHRGGGIGCRLIGCRTGRRRRDVRLWLRERLLARCRRSGQGRLHQTVDEPSQSRPSTSTEGMGCRCKLTLTPSCAVARPLPMLSCERSPRRRPSERRWRADEDRGPAVWGQPSSQTLFRRGPSWSQDEEFLAVRGEVVFSDTTTIRRLRQSQLVQRFHQASLEIA